MLASFSVKTSSIPDEIEAIADQHFSDLESKACPSLLKFGPQGVNYDDLIAGWIQYWNEVLNLDIPLDPTLIKALIPQNQVLSKQARQSEKLEQRFINKFYEFKFRLFQRNLAMK